MALEEVGGEGDIRTGGGGGLVDNGARGDTRAPPNEPGRIPGGFRLAVRRRNTGL